MPNGAGEEDENIKSFHDNNRDDEQNIDQDSSLIIKPSAQVSSKRGKEGGLNTGFHLSFI